MGRWTHLAITWDQATKMVGVYVDGQLDTAQEPEGVTTAKRAGGAGGMRLGGHTWNKNPMMLNGQLDEVRISSVARKYQTDRRGRNRHTGRHRRGPNLARGGRKTASKPWETNTEPTDAAEVARARHHQGTQKYTVVQGGTMDGRSCRSPMAGGMAREGAFFQTWESNRSGPMENVGETDLINLWLSNGRNNFRNVDEIVDAALMPGMTDAEKAFALWFQEIQLSPPFRRRQQRTGGPR